MHNNLGEIALDDGFEELLDFGDVLRCFVHLAQAIADLVLQQVTMLLNVEGLDQGVDRFDLLEGSEAEERVNALGNGCTNIIDGLGVFFEIVSVDDDHFVRV